MRGIGGVVAATIVTLFAIAWSVAPYLPWP